ncbi:hypothetical protein F0562_028752 [Nyssa sinensis]|uniref:BHLH domain-containing protein n=1 Tax=Nyssa sinensis TaxID=561372 RepID=A0A5J5B0Y9_9ASTE|nr:hypothetical protein F0562_028752 [Nyssa sinensis]
MEPLGAMSEGEWNPFSGMYSTEEADFMAQLLGNCSLPNELPGGSSFGVPSTFCLGHETTMNIEAGVDKGLMYSSDNANMYCFSQETSYNGGGSFLFPTSTHESHYLSDSHHISVTNNSSMSMDFCVGEDKNTSSPVQVFTNNVMEVDDCLNQEMSSGSVEECGGNLPETVLHGRNLQLKREPEIPVPEPSTQDQKTTPLENSKKRSWNSGDVQKKRNAKLKKNQKLVLTGSIDEENNAGVNRQSSSSCCSEDDSNSSQELNGVVSSSSSKGAAANLNGKAKANRGSATDPQSLYARKRRERINERLKILQNLVPNGTKVDISTMLEEAVQYVKFLQLQIKLLSSDDLWMYAPIAYNGMDIGLDLKITTPR